MSNVTGGESATRSAASELGEAVRVESGTNRSVSGAIEDRIKALLLAVRLRSGSAKEETASGGQEAVGSKRDHSES